MLKTIALRQQRSPARFPGKQSGKIVIYMHKVARYLNFGGRVRTANSNSARKIRESGEYGHAPIHVASGCAPRQERGTCSLTD